MHLLAMVVEYLKEISVGYHRNPGAIHIPRLRQQHSHNFCKLMVTYAAKHGEGRDTTLAYTCTTEDNL